MRVKTLAFTALLVAGGALGAALHAQEGRTSPTAEIEDPPRTFEEVGHQRWGRAFDSAVGSMVQGGGLLPESRVTIPNRCDVDPTEYGCPLFCIENPGHESCPGHDGGGDEDPTPNPGPGPGEPMWCGLPYSQWPGPEPGSDLYGQEKCSPVQGGWYCGSGMYWNCP